MAESYLNFGNLFIPPKDPQPKNNGENIFGIPSTFAVSLDGWSIIGLALIAFGTVAINKLT